MDDRPAAARCHERQTGPRDAPVAQRGDQRATSTIGPRGIDEIGAALHQGNSLRPIRPMSAQRQHHVQADDVGLPE
jgi:hypothetical protein